LRKIIAIKLFYPVLAITIMAIIAILVPGKPVFAASTTSVKITKYASDGSTILSQKTLTYQWLEQNLPVMGDGTTHYFHQGPVFKDDPNQTTQEMLRWNPEEDANVQEKDMGAVKGTNLTALCNQVGGMQSGDTIKVKAVDGFYKQFAYKNIYQYSSREGPMILTWYKDGMYPDSGYSDGMRLVWFADDSTNPWGIHAFGNNDWRLAADSLYWYYYQSSGQKYPTTTGLSVQNVSEIIILSNIAASTTPPSTSASTPFWDLNEDHICDIGDVVVIGQQWGKTGTHGWIKADVNNDGNIDIGDIVTLGKYWNGTW
jgi:hypothetical protein